MSRPTAGYRFVKWYRGFTYKVLWPTYAVTSMCMAVGCAVMYAASESKKKTRLQSFIQTSIPYTQAMNILKKHTKAQETLGPPIQFLKQIYLKTEDDEERKPQIIVGFVGTNECGHMVLSLGKLQDDDLIAEDPVLMGVWVYYVSLLSTYIPEQCHPYWTPLETLLLALPEMADWEYVTYLAWLFTPIVITFLIPVLLCVVIYCNAIFLHIYGLRHKLYKAYSHSYWDGGRSAIASFWDAQGRIWHGYEVEGLENIPETGPALIVYYHGTLPLDVYYLLAKCILHKNRTVHCVADKFLFKIPGLGICLKVFCVTPGSVDECVQDLQADNLLCISPGGVREALFADQTYPTLWGKRLGFAKIALRARVPVIPMFTENCREYMRTPAWGRALFRKLYEKTRLPLCPVYGGFPVKMKTYIGAPIQFRMPESPRLELAPPDPEILENIETEAAKELRELCEANIRDLILQHQRLPGSITSGILDRFPRHYAKFRAWKEEEWKNLLIERENSEVSMISETENSEEIPEIHENEPLVV